MYQAPPNPVGLVAIDVSAPDPVASRSPTGDRYVPWKDTHRGSSNSNRRTVAEAADDRCLADTLGRLARGPRGLARPDFTPAQSVLARARVQPRTATAAAPRRMPQPASNQPYHAYVMAALPKLLRQLELETAVLIQTVAALAERT